MKRDSATADLVRRALVMACAVGLAPLVFSSGAMRLERFYTMNTANAAGGAAREARSSLGDEGAMPELDGATGWLNSIEPEIAAGKGRSG